MKWSFSNNIWSSTTLWTFSFSRCVKHLNSIYSKVHFYKKNIFSLVWESFWIGGTTFIRRKASKQETETWSIKSGFDNAQPFFLYASRTSSQLLQHSSSNCRIEQISDKIKDHKDKTQFGKINDIAKSRGQRK